MHMRIVNLLALALLLGCRQPPAELVLPSGAEPTGDRAAKVIVEAPPLVDPGPILDWSAVDDRLAGLIEGQRYRIEYDAAHPWSGAILPLVTVVVFYDYQCPYSKRLNDVLAELTMSYGDSLRVVWQQFPLPFHAEAGLAARYALAAHAQSRFADVHAWLFEHSKSLSRSDLDTNATTLGLHPNQLKAELDHEWIVARIDADLELGRTQGITSTPTFFVNGRPFRGAMDRSGLEVVIREEIAAAERLLAAGSDRRELWARFAAAADPGPAVWVTPSRGPDPNKRYAMQLSGLTPRGAAKPKVEILMCGDFDCPFCAKSTAILADLQKRHPKHLAVYFRHMPLAFHQNAMAAHRAAVAADGQGKFWPMFDLLFADQKARSAAEIEAHAKQLKLDLKRFRKDLADPQTDAVIDQQREFCEKQLDSRGTPSFFINGRPLIGAQPIDAFEAIIAEELAASP